MRYKTMVLELLQQYPEIHEQLRRQRMLLPALELHARQLKACHEAWKDRLSRAKPGSDPSQTASEALEIALQELKNFLQPRLPPDDSEPLPLEGGTAFVRGHAPPAQRRQ